LVFEYLPEGLVYISSTVSKGFYNSTNNVWSIGDLNFGESVDLTLLTYVKVGNFSLTNNVYVTGNEYDWNITNNYGNKTILINSTIPSKDNNTENKTINITNTTITPSHVNNNTNMSFMNKTKIPYKNTTVNNIISNKNFNMKNTGNPIITLLLVLFALILISSYKPKKK
jgi:FlaG/FlaF family flagellin (archaellin)